MVREKALAHLADAAPSNDFAESPSVTPRSWPGQRLTILAVVAAFAIALIAGYFLLSALDQGSEVPSAVIVDQLSVGVPEPPFARSVTDQLEAAGYTVDYYPGEEVTVDFYRQLPTLGYDLILLRAHSGLIQGGEREGEAFLFTSEPYNNQKHTEDLSEQRLLSATYSRDSLSSELSDIPRFFGIVPDFIKSSMTGTFDGATIVLMGCNGLTSSTMAAAFVERGAKAIVSWDDLVTGDHTDAATDRLLELLLQGGLPLGEAVAQTAAEVGPDPWYGSELRFYPLEQAAATIP